MPQSSEFSRSSKTVSKKESSRVQKSSTNRPKKLKSKISKKKTGSKVDGSRKDDESVDAALTEEHIDDGEHEKHTQDERRRSVIHEFHDPPISGATQAHHPSTWRQRRREKQQILKKYYSLDLVKGFAPIRYFAVIFGKWPFSFSVEVDFTAQIRISFASCLLWYFILVSFFYAVYIVSFVIGFFMIYFTTSESTEIQLSVLNPIKEEANVTREKEIILNQYPIFLVFFCWLVVSFVGILEIIFKGNNFIHLFNYWNRAIQVSEFDLRKGLWELAVFEFFYIAFIFGFLTNLFFMVKGVKELCGLLIDLPMLPYLYLAGLDKIPMNPIFYYTGFFIVIFSLCSYRASVMLFIFQLKLLRNISKGWNERLKVCLEYGGGKRPLPDFVDKETPPYLRLNYKLVLKDHLIIAQLFKMNDNSCTWFLCAYFGLQAITLLFAGAHMWSLVAPDLTATQEIKNETLEIFFPSGSRKKITPGNIDVATKMMEDSIICIIVLVFTIFETFATSFQAHITPRVAEEGFKIARQHGFLKTKSATERNFLYNLLMSFSWKCTRKITAGGLFYVDKRITISIWKGLIILFLLTLTLNRIHQPLKKQGDKFEEERRKVTDKPVNATDNQTSTILP